MAGLTALTIEGLKKLYQIDRSTKGFVDIGPEGGRMAHKPELQENIVGHRAGGG